MPDQDYWDDAYANAAHIADAASYPPTWSDRAQDFRNRLSERGRAQLGVSYGDTARQAYDLFLPDGTPKGLSIFVHGGYWLRFDRSYWSHFAQGALAQGWAVAMPSYDLCPDVQIADITRQIAKAVVSLAQSVDGPITLSGHSAGGHLVARMLAPGILPADVLTRVKQVVPISPVADLRPLLKTSMKDDLQLDDTKAPAESPVLQPTPSCPVHIWVGGAERPVFLDQAQWLSDAWDYPVAVVPDRHHFDVIDALQDPETDLVRLLTLKT